MFNDNLYFTINVLPGAEISVCAEFGHYRHNLYYGYYRPCIVKTKNRCLLKFNFKDNLLCTVCQ